MLYKKTRGKYCMYDDFMNCYDKDMLIKNGLDEKSANGAFSIISKAI